MIAALVAVVALLAGCGGGSSDSTESVAPVTETTTALTKAELIERGDGICAEVNAALGTVGSSSSETGGAAEQEAGLYTGMIASLKNLGAPQETAGYAEFIAAAEALATAEDEVKLASERGDTAGLEEAESNASSALAEFQTEAEEYGFEKCGAGPSAPPVTESGETGASEAPRRSSPRSGRT